MKAMMMGAALCALMFAGCNKKPVAEAEAETQSAPVAARASAGKYVAPEEMESPFAPPGVFFLLERVSLETDSGVLSYLPGTKVIKAGSRYITSEGKQLTLKAAQITNDLRIATKLAGNNPKLLAAIQTSVRNTLATPNYMPPPPKDAQVFAKPNVERRTDGNGSSRPTLDGDERRSDRNRK
jgi:hypothetical protein